MVSNLVFLVLPFSLRYIHDFSLCTFIFKASAPPPKKKCHVFILNTYCCWDFHRNLRLIFRNICQFRGILVSVSVKSVSWISENFSHFGHIAKVFFYYVDFSKFRSFRSIYSEISMESLIEHYFLILKISHQSSELKQMRP